MDYSDHFIVFWEKGFGSNPFTVTDQALRVDIKDLLEKAELFYDVNVNKLKFVETGKSNTDKYRMMIFLKYQSEWLATGSGYDDIIGALWVNPSTCQPVGSTIAHEVGHSFQYQTYCDNPTSGCGWRYGFGENEEGGNCFGSNVLNGKLTRYIMKNGSIIIILMSICCHVINIRCMRLLVTPIILFRIIGV